MLELTVKMININLPVNHSILQKCMPLYEYSWFMEKIRNYLDEGMSRDAAVTLAIQDCIREGVFAEFVKKHGSEVENMLFTQFNLDDALAVRYEEGVEDGIEKGELRLLVHLVCGKLQKGESPEKIAADLLADKEEIARICSACMESGPDEDAVYKRLADTGASPL